MCLDATWWNRLPPGWQRSETRLYIFSFFIQPLCWLKGECLKALEKYIQMPQHMNTYRGQNYASQGFIFLSHFMESKNWTWRSRIERTLVLEKTYATAKKINKRIMEQINPEFSFESQMTIVVILSENIFPWDVHHNTGKGENNKKRRRTSSKMNGLDFSDSVCVKAKLGSIYVVATNWHWVNGTLWIIQFWLCQ